MFLNAKHINLDIKLLKSLPKYASKFFLMLIGISSCYFSYSQSTFSVVSGFNYSKITGEDLGDVVKYKPGFFLGSGFKTGFSRFYFQQSLVYCNSGFNLSQEIIESGKEITITARVNINSIDLPIVFGTKVFRNFSVFSGVQLEYMYSSNFVADAKYKGQPFLDYSAVENIINTDKYYKNGFSALLGFGYEFNKLELGFRYIHGITPLSLSYDKKDYNMLFQVTLDYVLFTWIEDNVNLKVDE